MSGKNLFWSIINSGEVLNKLKPRGFRVTSLSTYDFSTLYVGCSGSSCNLVIKVLNIDINLSFFYISQVDINELTSRN